MQSAGVTSTGNAASAAEEASATLNALLAAAEVVLSTELAEQLRWRNVTWGLIPPLSRKLVLPYLTVKETLRLDVSVTERGDEENPGDRDHLVKAYKGLRSGGFDEWVYSDANRFEGVRWVRKRGVDLRELKLEYKGERDADKVLGQLVIDKDEDMATYYALRSETGDTDVYVANDYRVYNSTTVIEALRVGYLEVAKCLLERGADVNKANDEGETPLYWASRNGHLEVVKTLLAAEAEVDKADNVGQTPLHSASYNGHVEVVKTLLAAEAEVDKTNILGGTPLHSVSLNGHVEVVKTLLAAKAEVNKANEFGVTPLQWASRDGHVEVVKVLLAAKAEVNKADNAGKTPLYWALYYKRTEVAALLRAFGATE
jgi:ankyrin repeat protein